MWDARTLTRFEMWVVVDAFGAHRESEGRNPPLSNSVNVCLVPKALLFPRIAVTFYGGRNLTAS
jgi:hypothetical protein